MGKGWKTWVCPKCGEIYPSPIPILAYGHRCPADYNRFVSSYPKKAREHE